MSVDVPDTSSGGAWPSALRELAASVGGAVLLPGTSVFDEAAGVHQLAAVASPAVIVRPTSPADVAASIGFARAHGLEIAVRSGGHSGAGHSTGDGVLVIDMRDMAAVTVDPVARRLRAGAGALAGAVVAAAGEHGLTVPLGDNATVGVAGITLGGGVGYLSRQHGLTIDHLAAVELVTADGRVVTASATAEPELFWALRGGGGNFGVVTSLDYTLVPAGMVYGGALLLPATRNVLRALAPLAGAAPRELGIITSLMPAPPAPFVPPEGIGQPAVVITGVYNGDAEAGEAAWAPFRALATPIADVVGPMPYAAIYRFTEGASRPVASVARSAILETIDDAAIDHLHSAFATSPGIQTIIQLRILGGAVADVPAGATAYAHRTSSILVVAIAIAAAPGDVPAVRGWADDVLAGLRRLATGAYVNFMEDEGEARIRDAYPAPTHRRLAAIKGAWDPENVFRRNHNIRPG